MITFDANLAGRDRSSECTLHIYDINQPPPTNLDVDHYGVLFINPETWNIQGIFYLELVEHQDILLLKQMLDLRHGLDYRNNQKIFFDH